MKSRGRESDNSRERKPQVCVHLQAGKSGLVDDN